MSYFSHLCCTSGESIPIASASHCPATVFYPDGTKDSGCLDGSGRIGEVNYLGKLISQIGGIRPGDVTFDLSRLQINLFLGDQKKIPAIQNQMTFKSLTDFNAFLKEMPQDMFSYRAFNIQCPTQITQPDGHIKDLDYDVYLGLDEAGRMYDPFNLPESFLQKSPEQLMDSFRYKVIMENTPRPLFEKALESVKIAKSKYTLESDSYSTLGFSAGCPHQGYFYPSEGQWNHPQVTHQRKGMAP